MTEILAPCLELLWCLADLLTESDKGISETVRVEVRQARRNEGITKYCANGGGGTPVCPF